MGYHWAASLGGIRTGGRNWGEAWGDGQSSWPTHEVLVKSSSVASRWGNRWQRTRKQYFLLASWPPGGFLRTTTLWSLFTWPVFISGSHHHVHLQQSSTSGLGISGGSGSVEFTEKGMAHREKVMPSRELRSLESRCHTTGLDLTSLAWHMTLFQVTMSLSASVSSPVKLEVKDRANCL